MNRVVLFGISLGIWVVLLGCGDDSNNNKNLREKPALKVNMPAFSADSAYTWIEKQLSFGPRVPNSPGHAQCANWLVSKFQSFGAEVMTQPAVVTAYDGTGLNMQNIIASYNPERAQRIMLSAHWDTRPVADQDTVRQDEPIPGANDGASGVAVLLEFARMFQQQAPGIGVDLVLWDAEDYGNSGDAESYCLGSQYWTKNKHKPNYQAVYGINLDMVGAANAKFLKEGHSVKINKGLVDRVWQTGRNLGYTSYFPTLTSDPIIDDHYFISLFGDVPMIDIIDRREPTGFFGQWHTHQDDIHVIDKATLQAVGHTVAAIVYQST